MTDPLSRAESQAAELIKIERLAQKRAVGDLAAELTALTKKSVAAAAVSPHAWQDILERLVALFTGLDAQAQQAAQEAIVAAWAVGLKYASRGMGFSPLELAPKTPDPRVDHIVNQQLVAARVLLTDNDQIVPALAAAKRTVYRVNEAITWHVNRAASDAVEATAQAVGMARRWVAERDACLTCVSMQGEVADAGEEFASLSKTVSFSGVKIPAIENPPMHPHCRCIIQLHDRADQMVITALKREAKRSVLKGWSLPSESPQERLQAADRLLHRGAGLPQSVEDAAARAVKRGGFKSRRVPTGR